jgi:hypothetical protein
MTVAEAQEEQEGIYSRYALANNRWAILVLKANENQNSDFSFEE